MMYPIMIHLEGQEVTVIGGGKVAYRKVKNFLDFECKVKVVSPHFIEDFQQLEDKISLIQGTYQENHITTSMLVIAATNDKDINEQIGAYCKANRILCDIVDNPSQSSFAVPAYVKRGDLTISISTNGKSPSLAARIKREIADTYSEDYSRYTALLGVLREKILLEVQDEKEKKELLNRLVTLSLEELEIYAIGMIIENIENT